MNKRILFLISFGLWCMGMLAQDSAENVRHDSLLRVGLTMTRYDKDTSADAVILSELGTVKIVPTYYHVDEYYKKSITIKILSQAGLSNGIVSIPLFTYGYNREKITELEAVTYNLEDDKIVGVALDKNEIHEEELSPYVTIERFAMPSVKVGSLVYVSYTTQSPLAGYFQWNFQEGIPVVFSQFNLLIPPKLHYLVYKQYIDNTNCTEEKWQNAIYPKNVFTADLSQGYDDILCTYTVKNINAFKEEPFMTTPQDYIMQIGFQSSYMNSWQKFTDNLFLDPYFAEYFESKWGKLGDIIDQLKIKGLPQKEKIKTIVNYVKTNYRWNKFYSGRTSKKMPDFLTEKSGNTADINLFLLALLRVEGFDTKPVLLSTRWNGKIKIKSCPIGVLFNDVVCYVKTDSLSLLLDATEPALPYYDLPPQCMNDYGFIVEKNDSSWIDLSPEASATEAKTMLIKFSTNCDSINCAFTIKASGYSGFNYRNYWDEGYEKMDSILTEGKGMQMKDSIKVYSKNDLEEPFSILYSTSSPLFKQGADSLVSSRLIFPPFLNEPISDNPLKMAERKYPVDMTYKRYFKYQSMIVIPTGYKISEQPVDANYSVVNGKATFSYKTKQISDNVIQVLSNLSFNSPVYEPNEYKELKDFYDQVIKKYKEPVILEKK